MRPTQFLKDGTLYWVIRLYDPADGLTLIDADDVPVVAVRKNGAATADTVTVTKRATKTGIYDCSCNPAADLEGDQFTLEESAVISAVAYENSWECFVSVAERGTDSANTVAPDNANIAAAAAFSATAASGVTTLLTRITSTLFAGITSLGGWLRVITRKDAAVAIDYATSVTELNANGGSGAGDFLNTSESLEAIAATAATTTLVVSSTAPVLQTIDPAGKITIHRGDYTTFDLVLGNLVGRSGKKLVFTIKPNKGDLTDDSDCYLQITEVDGAVLINGSADGVVAADASMTVLDQNTGQTRFVLKSDLTDLLPIGSNFWYDAQMFDAAGERHTKTEDRCVIDRDVTRRTS